MNSPKTWLLLFLLLPSVCHAWWNGDWSYRKKITLNTGASGADTKTPVDQFALLVRLHSGNFPFLDAKEDGSDVRFVANDDKTPLKYHIELYDSVNELALVWVQVPKVTPATSAEFLWVYFGNQKVGVGDDAKATYGAVDTAVYHFNEKTGLPKDATAYANHAGASTAVVGAPGLIDGGATFNGNAKVSLSASASLRVGAASGLTFIAWIRGAGPQSNAVLYEQLDGANSIVVGIEGDRPFVQAALGGESVRASAATALAAGKWHHIAATLKERLVLYIDGVEAATAAATAIDLGGEVTLGDAAAGGRGFKGDMDEVHLFNVARSPDAIKLAALSQGLDAKLLTFGEDEQGSGGGGHSYFRILLGAVTLDGWVVIAILAVMAVVSFWVMVGKARFIGRMQKGNRQFQNQFRTLSQELLSVGGQSDPEPKLDTRGPQVKPAATPTARPSGEGVEHSPLYRIYRVGLDELKQRFSHSDHNGGARNLSAQSIDAIKASLDAGLVRETHRLNSKMVLLTIAISGGPFLGLLGTVVGVMITFAAIAATGDVNVNSIAPGIAAALVATVAGLAVAIPALFGYNYLTSRIKDLTAEMQVFTDEFITKVAEVYSK